MSLIVFPREGSTLSKGASLTEVTTRDVYFEEEFFSFLARMAVDEGNS
jgi:hypothetical protein